MSNPPKLPIEAVLPELIEALAAHPAAVLQAPPGAGKTTRVPLALLDQPWLEDRRVLMLEPRRLAARAAAGFMARQLGQAVGQTVGYRMRLDTRVSAATRIEVVTEGVLTRLIQDDPELSGYGAVIFDEFHERSLAADLGLALARESQQALREDLRLLVMSATLDAEPVARLLGGCPLLTSEGRSYPVAVRYAPPGRRELEPHLAATLGRVLAEEPGSVLVFLPGTREIRRLARRLQPVLPPDVLLAPLYGELDQAAQEAAIAPAPVGRRKLVLATAIAETSLTIESVRVVVDAGQVRRPAFDPVSGLSRLVTVRVSQASAEQRRGRAGRLEPGVCYRLWSEAEQPRLAGYAQPEILEADLSALVLELAQWGLSDPAELAWLDPPPAPAWAAAQRLLHQLQALDAEGRITAHGRAMLRLGLPPRLAHMVLRGRQLGWARLAAELAALLGERDVLVRPGHSDVQARLDALRGEPVAEQVDRGRLRRVRVAARALQGRDQQASPEHAGSAGILLGCAYPERIAGRRRGAAARYRLANGRGAWLPEGDPLGQSPLLVAAELDGDPREARVFLAAPLSRDDLEAQFAGEVVEEEVVRWDDASDGVIVRRQRRYGELVLADAPGRAPDPEAVTAGLIEGLRRRGLAALPWDEGLRQWQARVELLRRLEPEAWPAVSDAALLEDLEQWFAPYAQGITRLSQLRSFPLGQALHALLDYRQQQALAEQAPERWQVPSGPRVRIDYCAGEVPVLAVKLQEMFGAVETPRIAQGRVALLVHLLSPARRPVQVTQDLAGFWRSGYREVRKELRGRYPKHPWPEDPTSAVPTRRTKRS